MSGVLGTHRSPRGERLGELTGQGLEPLHPQRRPAREPRAARRAAGSTRRPARRARPGRARLRSRAARTASSARTASAAARVARRSSSCRARRDCLASGEHRRQRLGERRRSRLRRPRSRPLPSPASARGPRGRGRSRPRGPPRARPRRGDGPRARPATVVTPGWSASRASRSATRRLVALGGLGPLPAALLEGHPGRGELGEHRGALASRGRPAPRPSRLASRSARLLSAAAVPRRRPSCASA